MSIITYKQTERIKDRLAYDIYVGDVLVDTNVGLQVRDNWLKGLNEAFDQGKLAGRLAVGKELNNLINN